VVGGFLIQGDRIGENHHKGDCRWPAAARDAFLQPICCGNGLGAAPAAVAPAGPSTQRPLGRIRPS